MIIGIDGVGVVELDLEESESRVSTDDTGDEVSEGIFAGCSLLLSNVVLSNV